MNRKIPFHELASLLAANCNITPDEAEDFIKGFFDLIAQSLTAGETVKIKSIGTFAPTGDADNPIEFIPDAQIADTINAPFALFEPEELSDTLSDAELSEIAAPAETPQVEEVHAEIESAQAVTEDVSPEPVEEKSETVSEAVSETPIPEMPAENTGETIVEEETNSEAIVETEVTTGEVSDTVTEPEPEPEAETGSEPESVSETEVTDEPVKEFVIRTKVEPKSRPTVPPTPTVSVTPAQAAQPKVTEPTPIVTPPAPSLQPEDEEEPDEYIRTTEQKSGSGFGMGFLIGILVGLALGACAVYFAIDYIFPTSTGLSEENTEIAEEVNLLSDLLPDEPIDTVAEEPSLPTDTVVPASVADAPKAEESKTEQTAEQVAQATPAQPKTATVKDTVKKGYLLNDMAKKHYGNKCFWVYIYEENKSKISNPNRVSPGLELVIPDAAKYGIDASSQESVNAAKAMAGKILTKYPR